MALMTSDEVAEYLKVQPQTLRRWRQLGIGPLYIRVGSGSRSPVRYEREEVERWLKENTFQDTLEEEYGDRGKA